MKTTSYSDNEAKYTPNIEFSDGGLPVSAPGNNQNNLGVAGFGKLGVSSPPDPRPDNYESNDILSTAKTLPVARGVASQIDAMNLHSSSDVDYYKFTLNKTGGSHNIIKFQSFVSGTQIELLDAEGNRQTFQSVSSENSTKTINLAGKNPGTYCLKISNLAGKTGEYKLFAWNTMSEDNKEGNNSIATATSLTGDTGSLSGVNIHSADDVDYYKVTLAQQGSSSNFINLSGVYGEKAELLDAQGKVISTGRNDISLNNKAAGVYYLKVTSDASWGGDYRISWNTTPSIAPDRYEPNNSRAAATSITATSGTFSNLTIHNSSDEDYFKIHLNKTGTQSDTISINFDNSKGDLDLRLYDSSGGQVDSSTSGSSNTESINLSNLTGGDYYVNVSGFKNAMNTYSLSWSLPSSSSSAIIAADRYESNNSRATATNISATSGTISNLTIHNSSDEDYFKIHLNRTGTQSDTISINFDNSRGDLDLRLYDSSGGQVDSSTSGSSNTESINLSNLAGGDYYVKVRSRFHKRFNKIWE